MDRVGAYSWHPSSDRWTWNDTMFHLLGYPAGGVQPSRALVVAHKHPDDRVHVEDVMADAVAHHLAYTHRHRIVSVDGTVHTVVAVGHPAAPDPRRPPGLLVRGWVVRLATWSPTREAAEATASLMGSPMSLPPALPSPPVLPRSSSPRDGPPPPGWSSWASVEHDRHVGRAIEVLAEAVELPPDAAGALLAHLANSAAEPLIVVAERVVAVSLDPEVEGLAGLLVGISVAEP
jgi:hypothetical protein